MKINKKVRLRLKTISSELKKIEKTYQEKLKNQFTQDSSGRVLRIFRKILRITADSALAMTPILLGFPPAAAVACAIIGLSYHILS